MSKMKNSLLILKIMSACAFALICRVDLSFANQPGIVAEPDAENTFSYQDDFSTTVFLQDTVAETIGREFWQPGLIFLQGPTTSRELVYRFIATEAIADFNIHLEQWANAQNFVSHNTLQISTNGLDWRTVASSINQSADVNGWQKEPLVGIAIADEPILGQSELWVRVEMVNRVGAETAVSNHIRSLRVDLTLKPTEPAENAVQTLATELIEQSDGRRISLWVNDDKADRPPHYFEQADGWLAAAEELPDDPEGITVKRGFRPTDSPRLSLVMFPEFRQASEQTAMRVTVQGGRQTSRELHVYWNDEQLTSIDTASFFEQQRNFDLILPVGDQAGGNELRLVPFDDRPAIIKQVVLAGNAPLRWAAKLPLPPADPLAVLAAEFIPDPQPPSDSQINARGMYEQHAEFGALRINLKNTGKETVRIAGLELNNQPIEEWYVDFVESDWDASGVVWYRIHPRTLVPDQCGEIYVRFRRRLDGDAVRLTIATENAGTISRDITYQHPDLIIDYVTTDASGQRLIAYIKPHSKNTTPQQTLVAVSLDGRPLSNAVLTDADMKHGVALVVAELAEPLHVGDYHTLGVLTASGQQLAAEFQVLPFQFIRSSIHIDPEFIEEMHMNLLMWNLSSQEICNQYDVQTTLRPHTNIFGIHDRVAYIYGPDEPDAFQDNVGGGHDRGLGYAARNLAETRQWDMNQRFIARRPWWLIVNATTTPLNWSVYGQVANIMAYDPYPTTFSHADHAYVRESLSFARKAGRPRRLIACLEAFTHQGRTPIAEEYRQNVVQAIGAGAKGLTNWLYPAQHGGWSNNPELTQAITSMNRMVEHIEKELLIASPVDWTKTDAGLIKSGPVNDEKWDKERVWTGTLLAGADTIIIAAANHIPASHPAPPKIEPAQNVTVTINVPDYFANPVAHEVTSQGIVQYPSSVKQGKVELRLDSLVDGRIFLLRSEK